MAPASRVVNFVDSKELQALLRKLALIAQHFKPQFESVKPEFGAYMLYSLFLEEGTKKMAARPHIKMSIEKNGEFIIGNLVREMTKLMASVRTGQTKPNIIREIENMWIRTLNDRPRILAVNETKTQRIFEFGFHRRSIRGFAKERTRGEIISEQTKGNEARKIQAMQRGG